MIHNITKQQYINDPCGVCSVAFWKNASYQMPDGVLVIHENNFFSIKNGAYELSRYFRLLHDLKVVSDCPLPNGYYFQTVNIKTQKDTVVSVINRCYKGIGVTAEQVRQWIKNKVFDNDLWVFICEKTNDVPVALGIADFDGSIKEGSLEWLQVLPEYRRQGLGEALIIKLLSRLKAKSDFVTVSGKTDNQANVEALYRKCGFYGSDIWCVLNPKKEKLT